MAPVFSQGGIMKKEDNRVLARSQARDLTDQEAAKVSGGVHTETVCTFRGGALDGDVSEC
jgi:hypothetical protein